MGTIGCIVRANGSSLSYLYEFHPVQSPPSAEETARVAQLKDEVERRDKAIARLRKENESLQVGAVAIATVHASMACFIHRGGRGPQCLECTLVPRLSNFTVDPEACSWV